MTYHIEIPAKQQPYFLLIKMYAVVVRNVFNFPRKLNLTQKYP